MIYGSPIWEKLDQDILFPIGEEKKYEFYFMHPEMSQWGAREIKF